MLHGLRQEMKVGSGVMGNEVELVTLQHIEHLNQGYPSRARRRHGDDQSLAVVAENGLSPHRLIVF